MFDLNVTLDRRALAKFRTLLSVSRLEAAKALTFTALKAQHDWRTGNRVFHRRNTWIDKGVRIKPATPGALVAQVGSIDKFMSRHVEGVGQRKVGNLFIPLYRNASDVPTHRQMRSRLRRMSGTKSQPFVRNGMLLRRVGRGSNAPLKVLGFLRKSADITPRLNALGIVERSVQRNFGPVYERLLLAWAARA